MTREDIIRMAREAGVRDDGDRFEFSEYKYLERFASLIFIAAKNPPKSSMTWHEGYEAGKLGERARLQAFMRQMIDAYTLPSSPDGLRQRPDKEAK